MSQWKNKINLKEIIENIDTDDDDDIKMGLQEIGKLI